MDLLNKEHIQSIISKSNQSLINSIILYQSVESTNALLNHTLSKSHPFQFCMAEHQTAGKGRLGRQWSSPFGQNIYLSCAWLVNKKLNELSGLSLVIGLACIHALENYGITSALKLKWPNDLFCHDQKLGGILIETAEQNSQLIIKIGIGINVNSSLEDLLEVTKPYTSLRLIEDRYHNRNEIIGHLVNALIFYCLQFEEHGFSLFRDDWNKVDYFLNQNVISYYANQKITGRAIGVNAFGNLLLQDEKGEVKEYAMGEVSLRKNLIQI